MSRLLLALSLIVTTSFAPAILAAPLLQDGDRVVFFGDSITVAHTFTRAVEQYVLTRDPGKKVTFINAGIGGHTAADGLARLDVDVLAHKPTVVVVNFGMNDSAYPDGTDGAAFEKNMGLIFDRLAAAKVRHVLWADTTPYDPVPGAKGAKSRLRSERIAALVLHAEQESARRGLVLVRWHQPIRDAVMAWVKAKRSEKLIPDRVHPSPALHAVMTTSLLRGLGYVPAPVVVSGRVEGDGVVVGGTRAIRDGAVTRIELVDVMPPLVLVGSPKDASDLGASDVGALREVRLQIAGLPPKETFRIMVGDVDVGRVTGARLADGVDLMATTTEKMRQPAPPGTTMTAAATPPPPFDACVRTTGNPFLNDHACLWGRLFQKDQVRVAMRHEKTRWFPDFVAGQPEAFRALMQRWVDEAEASIRAESETQRRAAHTIELHSG